MINDEKYLWDKKLKPGTSIKLITRKNRRFTAIKGTVSSMKNGKLVIKGKDGKEYVRKKPQKIFLKENEEQFPVKKIVWNGIPLEIENPAGTVRKGVDKQTGEPWETHMKDHYGRIPTSEGLDGDKVDVYLSSKKPRTKLVFRIMAKKRDGRPDEFKWMLGYQNADDAERSFRDHYDSPDYFGSIEKFSFETFKQKALKGKLTEIKTLKEIIDAIHYNKK